MLHCAAGLFIIALIGTVFGLGGIAASAVGIAKMLFEVFAVLAVTSFLFNAPLPAAVVLVPQPMALPSDGGAAARELH